MPHTKPVSLIAAALSLAAAALPAAADSPAGRLQVAGQLTPALASAKLVSRLPGATPIPLTLTFGLRRQAELTDLIRRLHDPADPFYGQYLTPAEFTDHYAPTQADYSAAIAFVRAQGLTVLGTSPNRLVLDLAGPASRVETAFGVRMNRYLAPNGNGFYAASANPSLPRTLAASISSVVGLDSAAIWKCHSYVLPAAAAPFLSPRQIGSGPGGGLTPANIKAAYNLAGVSASGAGQVLGLFQLDGYTPSDVRGYESMFGLPAVPLQNVYVDGVSGQPGGGDIEVTLDIELQSAMAPNASKIIVYEGPNSGPGVIDTYNKIATDNLAKQVSSSWGLYENYSNAAMRNAENAIFQQMAAQGQTVFAASGDSGAYDNGSTLGVDDPASQPYVTGVGGTALAVSSDGTYRGETTWNHGTGNGAGGGGISTVWAKPDYQSGLGVSTTQRNVPDVSLDADPSTGYAIAYHGGWVLVGGTSCAAPLWAGFTALVNQQRAANGLGTLGFANVPLYQIGKGTAYAKAFHDIADGSTNLKYAATTGYDDATGWGSLNGTGLLTALSGGITSRPPVTLPAAPASLTAAADNAKVTLTWPAVTGAATYSVYRGTTGGGEGSAPVGSGLTASSWTDTAVVNGTRYFYKVAALNSAGAGPVSPEANALPQAPAPAPAQVAALSLDPATVISGAASTGTVTLVSAAPANGTVVTLTSGNAAAVVPATVTVPAGKLTMTFAITTQSVTSPVSATLSAAVNSTAANGTAGSSVAKTAVLTIQPAPPILLSAFTVSPPSVNGGTPATATITLSSAAAGGGTVVKLSSSNPNAPVPATMTVPAGKTTLTFSLPTTATGTGSLGFITAASGTQSKSAPLTVQPAAIASVVIAPASIVGGSSGTGTVTLTSIAPVGGGKVLLYSGNNVSVPASVTVAAGATTAAFPVTTTVVTTSASVTIYAAYNSLQKTIVTVLPVPKPTHSTH